MDRERVRLEFFGQAPTREEIWRAAGRNLIPGWALWSLNGDRTDIRLENLVPLPSSLVGRMRATGNIPPAEELIETSRRMAGEVKELLMTRERYLCQVEHVLNPRLLELGYARTALENQASDERKKKRAQRRKKRLEAEARHLINKKIVPKPAPFRPEIRLRKADDK